MSDHFTKPTAIVDGTNADASDINDLSDAVLSGFNSLETEVDGISYTENLTWTPTLTAGTSGTFTYTPNGRYQVVGNLVSLSLYIIVSGGSSPSGEVRISVPYQSTVNMYIPIHIISHEITGWSAGNVLLAHMESYKDYFHLQWANATGSVFALDAEDFNDNSFTIYLNTHYFKA